MTAFSLWLSIVLWMFQNPSSSVIPSGGTSTTPQNIIYARDFTRPTLADFAWVNQGSASATTDANGNIVLVGVSAATTYKILKKAAPSTPYTIEAAMTIDCRPAEDCYSGLTWRAAGGKLHTIQYACQNASNTRSVQTTKYNADLSYNAHYTTMWWAQQSFVVWFQIIDDGTNRTVKYSITGDNWFTLGSPVARTDWDTMTEVGFMVDKGTTTLLHWRQF